MPIVAILIVAGNPAFACHCCEHSVAIFAQIEHPS